MPSFESVMVVKETNVYFASRVTSRSINFPDVSKKKLGVTLPEI